MLDSVSSGVSLSESGLKLQLPKSWPATVRSAMWHVIPLAKYAAVYTCSWAADSPNARVRAEGVRSQEDASRLREELRIKDARMTRIPSQRRPFYTPTERLSILEMRAARGWSVEQTANTFLVTAATVSSGMKRVDEDGSEAIDIPDPPRVPSEIARAAPVASRQTEPGSPTV